MVHAEDWIWDPAGESSKAEDGNSMSQGTIIGIAVGVVGGVLFLLAAALAIWYYRRWRGSGGRFSSMLLRSRASSTAVGSSDAGEPNTRTQTHSPSEFSSHLYQPVMEQMPGPYEVDSRNRVELANDSGKYEMDPQGHGSAELDPSPKQQGTVTLSPQNQEVSPITPTHSDSTPQHGDATPRSPPPQYSE